MTGLIIADCILRHFHSSPTSLSDLVAQTSARHRRRYDPARICAAGTHPLVLGGYCRGPLPRASAQPPREAAAGWQQPFKLLRHSLCCVSPVRRAVLSACPPSGRFRAGTQQAHRRVRRLPPTTGAALAFALSSRSRSWLSDGPWIYGTRFWRASLRSDSERAACGRLTAGPKSCTVICDKIGCTSNHRNRYCGMPGWACFHVPLHCKTDEPSAAQIKRAGFASPTPIQAQAWPIAMAGRDMVAIAKTGTSCRLYCSHQ